MKNRLKKIMDEHGGYGISELVDRLQEHGCDVSVSTISNVYHNRSQSIRYDVLQAILNFFSISPNDFFERR